MFEPGVEYLLPLINTDNPYAKTRENSFVLIRNIVIDLDEPAYSIMYSESLSAHSEEISFGEDTSQQEIISHMDDLTRDNPPAEEFIRSEEMEDVISGSPYILVVEVNEPFRLSDEQSTTDWMRTDIYYTTILQVLKGDRAVYDVSEELMVIFFADTVLPGEQHIVAVETPREGSTFYRFTSRNSLFHMDQLDEILAILG